MSGIGDLSSFLNENSIDGFNNHQDFFAEKVNKEAKAKVWDSDWLEINPEDYNSKQILPDNEKKLNSLQQLEQVWDYSGLVKNLSKDSFFYSENTHNKLETKPQTKESSFDIFSSVLKISQDVRKLLTLGYDEDKISNYLNNKYTKLEIQASIPTIDILIDHEYGLLGNVYIDPSVFKERNIGAPKSCDNGSKELRSKSSSAKYIKAMKECGSCIFNQKGSCSKFSKTIVENINYDVNLIEKLAKDLIAQKRITSEEANRILTSPDPIKGIKQAFTAIKKVEKKIGGIQVYPELKNYSKEELNNEIKKLKRIASENKKLASFISYYNEIKPIWDFTNKELMNGSVNSTLRQKLASQFGAEKIKNYAKSLRDIINQQGLLGKIYITTEPWDWNCKKAKNEIKHRDALNSPFVMETPKCASCVFNQNNSCSLFKKTITANLNNIDIEKSYPKLIEELYQRNKLNLSDKNSFLSQKPSLEGLKQAFLYQKEKVRKIGGVKGKMMPLTTSKTLVIEKKTPVTDYIKQELHKGNNLNIIIPNVRNKFASSEIKKEDISLLQDEVGLLGNVYIDPLNYNDCKVGAKEFNKKASLAFIKASTKCFGCIFNKQNYCQTYKRPILGTVDWKNNNEINWEKIAKVHFNYLLQNGKLSKDQINSFSKIEDKKYALKLAYTSKKENSINTGNHQFRAYTGQSNIEGRNKEETINLVTSSMLYHMNNGLYGKDLASMLKKSFDQEALDWSKEEIIKISKEDVVLGNVYVNPILNGGDCNKQASYIRKNPQVNFVQVNQKCAGCIYNKKNKECSLIKLPLINKVEYTSELMQSHFNILSNKNKLDSNFKVASSDPKKLIQMAYKYIKPKTIRIAGVQHEEKEYIRKKKLDLPLYIEKIKNDFLKGLKVDQIYSKYASTIPGIEIKKILSNLIKENTYNITLIKPKEQPKIENDVKNFELTSSLDCDVNEIESFDMGDYLD